jgi:hypothetical protein
VADDRRRFEDDAFAPSHLPMARRHPERSGRGRLYLIGTVALVLITIPFLADTLFGSSASVSDGPLSASHVLFGAECGTCHTPGNGTPDVKCSACHEKAGDPLGSYSFARHYLYRSADFDRSAPSTSESACSACHVEHQGREASLSDVADATCASCHAVASLAGHSDFEFITESRADPANLRFQHILHVREVMEDEDLDDIETTCLRCHEAEPEGRFFRPISFERQCDDCHLGSSTATTFLPVETGSEPGVLTLDEIRQDPEGIAAGADYWDPNELRARAGTIQKRPVYHADPWILFNLRRLRATLYPGAELADLLMASSDVTPGESRVLHEEAVATLRTRIRALGGDPSRVVQEELEQLEELLDLVEQRLADPYAPVDRTRFDVRVADRAPGLDDGTLDEAAFVAVVDSLTAVCQSCHIVDRATITRVQTDQRTLVRSEFDHRAHILLARCLDCHSRIPVREWTERDEDPPADVDDASIQNIPDIGVCRDCHKKAGPSASCTSCHLFHPDRSHWANLSRYRHPDR